jgi:hypothetical protein
MVDALRAKLAVTQDQPEQSCGNCRFFKDCIGYGLCRRSPPHVKHGFPESHASNWCGEWQSR